MLLASCATPYKALGPSGGYSERELIDGSWEVSFRGNPLIEPALVREYTLLRCAELAEMQGYSYFIIWADSSYTEVRENRQTPNQPWTHGGSSINQTVANPDVTIDSSQEWAVGRFIVMFYRAEPKGLEYALIEVAPILERHAGLRRR
jgi:hypothetical protein